MDWTDANPPDEAVEGRSTLRFVLTFGILLGLAEGLLRFVDWIQFEIGFRLEEYGASFIEAGFAAALANGVFSYIGVVLLFALFEWRQLGFSDFR
ncbi:MAG: hypothetical protein ABJP82_20545, partial [Hyphomicrobiales bacterium]